MADTATFTCYSLLDIDMQTLVTRDFTTSSTSDFEKEQEVVAYIRRALRDMINAINNRDFDNEVFQKILAPNHKNISEGPYFAHHTGASALDNIRAFAEDEPDCWIKSGTVSVVPNITKNTAEATYSMELHGVPHGVTRPAVTQQEWKKSSKTGVWQVLWCRTFFGMPLQG